MGINQNSEHEKDYDDPEIYPLRPGVDTTRQEFRNRFVEYNVRGPDDGIRSGPLSGGWGPGRFFRNRAIAFHAMCHEYGKERVRQLEGYQRGRWAFLIKNLKTQPRRAVAGEQGRMA